MYNVILQHEIYSILVDHRIKVKTENKTYECQVLCLAVTVLQKWHAYYLSC